MMRTPPLGRRYGPVLYYAALLGAMACLAGILLRFPPSSFAFYPSCPVFALLRIQCPGCGTTRALAALVHGDLGEALRWNALTISSLPIAGTYAALPGLRPRLRNLASSPASIFAAATVVVLFTVARNL